MIRGVDLGFAAIFYTDNILKPIQVWPQDDFTAPKLAFFAACCPAHLRGF
jgi:hypothetical protein